MKMKSVLVSMLALAAVFSSCSKDGETPGQGGFRLAGILRKIRVK